MFLKYLTSTVILCLFMLGYLYISPEIEESWINREPEINFHFSEDTKELSSGDASFVLTIKNLNSEQNVIFRLEKEMSDGWEANFCFNDICFLDHTDYTMKNGENIDVLITVAPDYDEQEEGKVRFLVLGDKVDYEKEFYGKSIQLYVDRRKRIRDRSLENSRVLYEPKEYWRERFIFFNFGKKSARGMESLSIRG